MRADALSRPQFDLDEHFASERLRLAQLTNKCMAAWRCRFALSAIHVAAAFAGSDDDLEYFVRESGNILGVTGLLPEDKRSGKHVLEFIFRELVRFKKLNQSPRDVHSRASVTE